MVKLECRHSTKSMHGTATTVRDRLLINNTRQASKCARTATNWLYARSGHSVCCLCLFSAGFAGKGAITSWASNPTKHLGRYAATTAVTALHWHMSAVNLVAVASMADGLVHVSDPSFLMCHRSNKATEHHAERS